ncbi:MAG: helix-turn-helix domain-containing protein [Nitrospinota bacterium]|nr:helix-turn-helix domain-containing protein [Nitrospinota bacterium]
MISENELLTTKQAAQFLAVTPSLLIKLRGCGGGPKYLKIARNVRYRRGDIEKWLASNERASTSDDGLGAGKAVNYEK